MLNINKLYCLDALSSKWSHTSPHLTPRTADKAPLLSECISLDVDVEQGTITALPQLLHGHRPDPARLPSLLLALGRDVEWDEVNRERDERPRKEETKGRACPGSVRVPLPSDPLAWHFHVQEKACFGSLARALAEAYAMRSPLLPEGWTPSSAAPAAGAGAAQQQPGDSAAAGGHGGASARAGAAGPLGGRRLAPDAGSPEAAAAAAAAVEAGASPEEVAALMSAAREGDGEDGERAAMDDDAAAVGGRNVVVGTGAGGGGGAAAMDLEDDDVVMQDAVPGAGNRLASQPGMTRDRSGSDDGGGAGAESGGGPTGKTGGSLARLPGEVNVGGSSGAEGEVDEADGPSGGRRGCELADHEWMVRHVVLPAMRGHLRPPKARAGDGSCVQVASLERLYRIFERC